MRSSFFLAVAVLLVFSVIKDAHAQEVSEGILGPKQEGGFLIGPIGGINLVAYNSNAFPIINSEPTCFTAQNGSGAAPWGGLTAEIPLGSLMQNFIVIEGLYNSQSSPFTANNGSVVTRPTKLNGVEDPNSSVTTKLTATLNYFVVNLAYKYNFTEGPAPVGPGLQLGPSVGIKMATKLNKTVTVTASSGDSRIEQSQTVTNPSDVTGAQSIRLALRGQFTYDIPFSQSWIATPTVGYDFPLTKVDQTRSWSSSAAYGGIAIRYFWRAF